jgi:hypothetical protein
LGEDEVVFGVVAVHVVGGGGGSGGDDIVCVVLSGVVVDRGWGRCSVCGVVVGGWRMVQECRDEGGPCGGAGGAEEGCEECSEGRGGVGHDV